MGAERRDLSTDSNQSLLENTPKVLAKGIHQYRLQKHLIPLASGDQRYGVWYRVKALPGTKTPV